MQQIKPNLRFVLLVAVLFLISCNETETASEKNDKDTSQFATIRDDASMPEYDPAMDSYEIGGDAIKKLGDTLGVKMYEFTAKPGETFKLHSHPDHTAYVLQGGKVALYIKALGRQDTLEFPTGMAIIGGPITDSGKNIGNTPIKMVVTDIYRPRKK